ncbi:MAG: hypothetical protein NUV67_02720 [archaeon]|nr:hypothetical protein [archaeon]
MNRLVYWTEKSLFLIVGFLIVVYLLSVFKIWSSEQSRYFSFIGDWESVILLTVIVFVITFVMERLWKWEVREIFKPPQIIRRKKR